MKKTKPRVGGMDRCGVFSTRGHVLDRNARRRVEMHPDCEVWVGVGIHSDKLVRSFHRNPVMTMEERVSAVRASCLADAVYPNAPMGITREFMLGVGSFTADRHKIDYVAVDESKSFHAADKIRDMLLDCKEETERGELLKSSEREKSRIINTMYPRTGKFLLHLVFENHCAFDLAIPIVEVDESPSPRKRRINS